jgi:hypothetical protein
MDDEMIERLAKSLVDPDFSDLDIDGTPLWKFQIPKVIAVIKAMREPTEKMKAYGCVGFKAGDWQIFIDAILND